MKTAATGTFLFMPATKVFNNKTRVEFSIKSDKAKNPYRIVIDMDDYELTRLISELKIAAESRAKVHDNEAQMLRQA